MIKGNEGLSQDISAFALYPVAEVKRLYEIQVMYAQALSYIEFLEQENCLLQGQVKLLQSDIELNRFNHDKS